MTHAMPGERPTNEDTPTLNGERVVLRAPGPGETEKAATLIANDPEANPWWGDDAGKILRWLTDPSAVLFVIDVDGELGGIILYEEENDPDYKLAGIDVTLLAPWIGRGYGRDALVTLARYLFEQRGHHRIQIDPAVANERAIRAYERVGFRAVGVMRRYERGPDGKWRDALLMDMLREELTAD